MQEYMILTRNGALQSMIKRVYLQFAECTARPAVCGNMFILGRPQSVMESIKAHLLKYTELEYLNFLLLHSSTPLHCRDTYFTFILTTFL